MFCLYSSIQVTSESEVKIYTVLSYKRLYIHSHLHFYGYINQIHVKTYSISMITMVVPPEKCEPKLVVVALYILSLTD